MGKYPVPMEVISGELPQKNVNLQEAMKLLSVETADYTPPEIRAKDVLSGGHSYYYEKFIQGCTIVPRNFWFVQIPKHGIFAVNPKSPYVVTDEDNEAKPPWDKVKLSGNVEIPFLFATMLSTDLVPFGYVRVRPVVLPVFLEKGRFSMIPNAELVSRRGYNGAADYFAQAEKLWGKFATAKARKFSIHEWVNYRNKLTEQNPRARFKVLYVASSTYLAACTLSQQDEFKVEVDGTTIGLNAFVAESKTYWYETDSEEEAEYLTAILNSPVVDEFIKPLQTRGLWGARDIHKRPLQLPIPRFDQSDYSHARLAELGKSCRKRVSKELSRLADYKSIGRARSEIRDTLSDQLEEINKLTTKVLSKKIKSGDLSHFLKG